MTSNYKIKIHTISALRWGVLLTAVAVPTGCAVALFLWLLDWVTHLRWRHEWLLFLLPVAGLLIQFMYKRWGKQAAGGNNLVLEEIHKPGGGVPLVMAPLVLFTSIFTHLFGGSAGREGTAVQIGGSFAGTLSKRLKLPQTTHRILLKAGIAAGFGAVFGTPIAAALFAIEVPYGGKIKWRGWLQCLLAAFGAHFVCSAWGIQHLHYKVANLPNYTFATQCWLLLVVGLAAMSFGGAARLFSWLTHQVSIKAAAVLGGGSRWIPVVGGVAIIGLSLLPGGTYYLGLGATTPGDNGISIAGAFGSADIMPWAWLLKLLFTAITLGTGFKGGEVTPLFFIGATLGNTLGSLAGMPADLFAALGFIAVFAAAANTPLACIVMGMELFGAQYVPYFALACCIAWLVSGHTGIYHSQRIGIPKRRGAGIAGMTIKEIQNKRKVQ